MVPLELAWALRWPPLMRVASSFKLIVATWVAALLGALVGRSLAEASHGSAGAPAPSVAVDTVGAR